MSVITKSPLSLVLACVLIFCLQGCYFPREYLEFNKLEKEEQHARFKAFPMNKQIDFYFYSMSTEPPDLGFADDIASARERAIPVLLERLDKEPDYRQEHLIYVFKVMHETYFDLRARPDVISKIAAVVDGMSEATWKQMSQQSLSDIRKAPPRKN